MLWIESSLDNLYNSAVLAFPQTTKRQHAIDPITIVKLEWTPFLGMKTLFVKGVAQSSGKEYNPVIVFKKVAYHEVEGPNRVSLKANDGETYFLEQLSVENTDVLVRCNCQDFYWRFNYYDHLDKSLQGPKRKKYVATHNPGSANPLQKEGMCKHLMKMAKALKESGVIG